MSMMKNLGVDVDTDDMSDFQSWALGTGEILEGWARDRGYENSIEWRINESKIAREWDRWHSRACWLWGHRTGNQEYCDFITRTSGVDAKDKILREFA